MSGRLSAAAPTRFLERKRAAIGGIRPGQTFAIELADPVLKRKLWHEYRIKVLPVEG